jgi:hypothetical protein
MSRTVQGKGPPCPRCRQPTQIREHESITAKELAKPFYYRRWYICGNRQCRTTTIMPEECKVFPGMHTPSPSLPESISAWEGRIPTRKIGDFMELWRAGRC